MNLDADNVLILGDPADPMVLQWKNYCETAGMSTTLYLDPENTPAPEDIPFTVLLNTNVEVPFFHLHHLPDSLYEALDEECLFLSNCLAETPTSSAAEIDNDRCLVGYSAIGLYVGNPVVEIASAVQTDARFLHKAHRFLEQLGLRAIEVPETPGLVLGRILAMLVNEATSALMEDVASPEDIDTAMKLGTNYPFGPLGWADLVGLDVILATLNHLEDTYGDDRYCAMPLLRQKVDAGKLGRKAGEGFYSYHPEHARRSL
ncbi:MAG: 3-hydroxybutyryl-CoA dehydrogenase [Vampirovibrio sp.]|jgi:3-hydroxybutyryl-CoA dehydrogenase|nr:3-hydroxybutyryl-CoA dehydrogenase [Vampirovibrio sp.]